MHHFRCFIQGNRLAPARDDLHAADIAGQWVDEQQLAEPYAISRTLLGEALKLSNAEGLVTPEAAPQLFRARVDRIVSRRNFLVMARLEARCAFELCIKQCRRLEETPGCTRPLAALCRIRRYQSLL